MHRAAPRRRGFPRIRDSPVPTPDPVPSVAPAASRGRSRPKTLCGRTLRPSREVSSPAEWTRWMDLGVSKPAPDVARLGWTPTRGRNDDEAPVPFARARLSLSGPGLVQRVRVRRGGARHSAGLQGSCGGEPTKVGSGHASGVATPGRRRTRAVERRLRRFERCALGSTSTSKTMCLKAINYIPRRLSIVW